MSTVDRARLAELHARERAAFTAARPRSRALAEQAAAHMPGGVPMSWMVKWPGDFPVFVEHAEGAHFTCVDGIDHVDLCLGDTGAMMGHSPAPTVEAVTRQLVPRDHDDAAHRGRDRRVDGAAPSASGCPTGSSR